MPMLIGLLIVAGALYQFFFRFEHLPSKREGVFYEHDNLTGETRRIKAGEIRTSVFARILGNGEGESVQWEKIAGDIDHSAPASDSYKDSLFDRIDPDEVHTSPVHFESGSAPVGKLDLKNTEVVAKVAKAIPVPKEVVVASSAPPVPPMSMLAANIDEPDDAPRPFAIRQIDLNDDGNEEEVIQNAVHSDGLLDISIVKGGREIFFGRGTQVSLLPTRSEGWSDIALKQGKSGLKVFRYNAAQDAYKPLEK